MEPLKLWYVLIFSWPRAWSCYYCTDVLCLLLNVEIYEVLIWSWCCFSREKEKAAWLVLEPGRGWWGKRGAAEDQLQKIMDRVVQDEVEQDVRRRCCTGQRLQLRICVCTHHPTCLKWFCSLFSKSCFGLINLHQWALAKLYKSSLFMQQFI